MSPIKWCAVARGMGSRTVRLHPYVRPRISPCPAPSTPPPCLARCSFGLALIALLTQQLLLKRGQWHLPRAPQDCPQVGRRAGGGGGPGGPPLRPQAWDSGSVAVPVHEAASCPAPPGLALVQRGAVLRLVQRPPLPPPASLPAQLLYPDALFPALHRDLQAVLDLIESCLALHPQQRPSAAQALACLRAAAAADGGPSASTP